MDNIAMEYKKENMDVVYAKVKQLIKIVNELEAEFVGRKFTLDGHLVGSIGEVLAAYYYGLELLPPSAKTHDAVSVDGKNVQIKITQANTVVITSEPDYLIVLFLDKKTGDVFEVYNGLGKEPWESSYLYKEHNTHYMRLPALVQMDTQVMEQDRIRQINEIPKYKKIVRENVKKNVSVNIKNTITDEIPAVKVLAKSKKKGAYSTAEGFVNTKNQKNLGKTDMKGTDHGQWFYQMECLNCHHKHLANGSNISAVKCPVCS